MRPPGSGAAAAPLLRVPNCGGASVHALLDYERCLAPGVCGNKARKLLSLHHTLAPGSRVSSHGGAQSNAMLALAHLCRSRDAQLAYHTRPLPKWLREQPVGNFARALDLGMRLHEHASADAYEAACADASAGAAVTADSEDDKHAARTPLFVPQGAAWPGAEVGVAGLADEIRTWWEGHEAQEAGRQQTAAMSSSFSSSSSSSSPLSVVVPSGTGTGALFLARHVPPSVRVYAVPCVGGPDGLRQQMRALDAASGAVGIFPEVLAPPAELTTPFAAPSAAVLASWREAAEAHGLLLDLVYGAIAFGTLASRGFRVGGARATLYVHCGGLEGLDTSLRRYARSGLLREGETAAAALATARAHAASIRAL